MSNYSVVLDTLGAATFTYWEVFKYAKDRDVFEIVSSPADAKGRVLMKESPSGGLVMKKPGTYDSSDTSNIILPTPAITGAVFKRVEQFTPISSMQALEKIKKDQDVYFKDDDDDDRWIRVNAYSDWESLGYRGISDFEDFFNTQFFVRNT
ncbi:hypothetical protein [Bacillus licheniformis]|uniref:hypothetical protein n=1 Tax=Bacillus licheniformis TaxID=1402 RepID=UPI0011A84EFE|nr:hypothetical protein [Bacillus licheniformis]